MVDYFSRASISAGSVRASREAEGHAAIAATNAANINPKQPYPKLNAANGDGNKGIETAARSAA